MHTAGWLEPRRICPPVSLGLHTPPPRTMFSGITAFRFSSPPRSGVPLIAGIIPLYGEKAKYCKQQRLLQPGVGASGAISVKLGGDVVIPPHTLYSGVMEYNADNAGAFAGQAVTAGADITTGWTFTKAYHNYMDMSGGDRGYSAWQAAVAARRWRVFYWFCILWVLMRMFGLWMLFLTSRPGFTDYTGATKGAGGVTASTWIALIPQVLILGIFYCRNIDAALFKRRAVYRLFAPVRNATDWINAGFLWAGFLLLPIIF